MACAADEATMQRAVKDVHDVRLLGRVAHQDDVGKKAGSHHTIHHYATKEVLSDKIAAHSGVNKVAIIGGGVAGIVTARIFMDEGVDVTVFECTGELGGVWAEGYVEFGIQVPSALYEFPDDPLPEGFDFCGGELIDKYVKQYARKHRVPEATQFNTRVVKILPLDKGYELTVDHKGQERKETFDLVIVATGVYGQQDKFIPNWKGSDKFKGTILHCVDYQDLNVSKDKHVISVGYGKSAFDCAQISTKVSRSSTMLFRKAHWCIPRRILGMIPFEFATFSRFGAACMQPAYVAAGPFERILHAIPFLLSWFWILVAQIFKYQFGMPRVCVPETGFIADFWGGHGVILHPNFFPLVNSGKIKAKKGEIVECKEQSVVLGSGEELPCDVIIAATGYERKRTFLPKEVSDLKEKDGLWLYRQMIHPDHPNLVFLNSEITTFQNITSPSIQARWLVELLAGNHELPSKAAMKTDIAQMQDWKRSSMPNAGFARSYMIQTHAVHYYDQLLKDMGANIRRKTGNIFTKAVKEIFDPYRPRDYKKIVTGEFKCTKGDALRSQSNFAKEGLLLLVFSFLVYRVCIIFNIGLRVTMSDSTVTLGLVALAMLLLSLFQ